LEVFHGPSIDSQPADAEHCLGESAAFSVGATGVEPLQYRWTLNGVDIPGAVEAELVFTTSQETLGTYRCFIRDDCGTEVASHTAELTTGSALFESQPQGATVCVGDSVFLFAGVTGLPSFQWFKDGQAIPGAILPFYSISQAAEQDSGTYHVTAANACGTTASEEAEVVVVDCG
jgi:hypothetical protein